MRGGTTAWVRHDGLWQASGNRDLPDNRGGGETTTPTASDAGAKLPITYDTASLPGTKIYMATNGTAGGSGASGSPVATLAQAVAKITGTGQCIVIRAGTYSMPDPSTAQIQLTASHKGLLITADNNAEVIFNGSIPAPAPIADTGLVRFAYKQMPSRMKGDGGSLTNDVLPVASFSGTTPTGLAAERGFAIVTSETAYTIPSTQTKPASGNLRVITGFFSDQVWVDGVPLRAVSLKSKVKPGFFWVDRGNDQTFDQTLNRTTTLWMHPDDHDGTKDVQVSSAGGNDDTNGNFLFLNQSDNVHVRGIKFRRYSPSTPYFLVSIAKGTDGVKFEDCVFQDTAITSFKFMGGSDGKSFSGAHLIKNTKLIRCTFDGAGWLGSSMEYTDDTRFTSCLFMNINKWAEFDAGPKSGCIKASRNHRLVVEFCDFRATGGHQIWMDQSNFDCTVASSIFQDSVGQAIFWEISDRLLIVNNLIVRSSDSAMTVRLSGGGGAWLINNTIVGGSTTLAAHADARGAYYTGSRPFSEHAERYGAGDYTQDSGGHPFGDLDSARPGEFHATLASVTPGMMWRTRAYVIVNNIIAHYSTSTAADSAGVYLRGKTANAAFNIVANQLIPPSADLFNGNIYQVAGSRMAFLDVASGQAGGTGVMANLSQWRGTSGLKQTALYGASANPEANAREGKGPSGLGWVTRKGKPNPDLDKVQGTAGTFTTTDTAMLTRIKTYIDPNKRIYGSSVVPPGGW